MKIKIFLIFTLNMNLINSSYLKYADIESIFRLTDRFLFEKSNKMLAGKILANCFFEESTRTCLSFETAMKKLGGEVINFNKSTSSIKKGESDYDTLKTIEQFADIIVLRHPSRDLLYDYESKSKKIIINGGNGDGEHPTQALLDLYTIKKYYEKSVLNKKSEESHPLKLLFVGDIKHSRTIHSLDNLIKISCSNIEINHFPYPGCEIDSKLTISSYENINEYDVVYMTRLQKERFENKDELNNSINSLDKYILTPDVVSRMKEESIILHPLPRNEEIDESIDNFKQAKYFEQVENGVYVRMAIIWYFLSYEMNQFH